MKLFRTKSIDVVKDCQYFFGAVLPSVLVLRKADKLVLRYQCGVNLELHLSVLLIYLIFQSFLPSKY